MTCLPIGMRCSSSRLVCWILDEDAALAADARAEIDDAVDLGDFRGVLRTARFEQLGHTRQTAGDVLGLRGFARRLGHERAGDDLVAFVHDDVRAGRNRIIRERLALVVDDDDLRMQIFLVFDDDHGFLAGGFVHFLLHRDAFDDVVEFHLARFLGENRDVVRIPLHEGLALLDLAAVLHGNDRTDHDVVAFEFAAVFGQDGDGTVLVQDDVVAVLELRPGAVRCSGRRRRTWP